MAFLSPVYRVRAVPIEKIEPNTYNPNSVAPPELQLLYDSSHNVDLMSNIIQELHELGRSDAWISKHLGMDRDEILRLKQLTGLTALFRDVKFSRAWQAVSDGLKDEPEEEEEPALSF